MKFNKYIILFLLIIFPFFVDNVDASTLDTSDYYYLDYENLNLDSFSLINGYSRLDLLEYLKIYIDENNVNNYFYSIFNTGNMEVSVYISSCPFSYSYSINTSGYLYNSFKFNCNYNSYSFKTSTSANSFNNNLSNIKGKLSYSNLSYEPSIYTFSGSIRFNQNVSKTSNFIYYSNFSNTFFSDDSINGTYYNFSYNNNIYSIGSNILTYYDFSNNVVPEQPNSFSKFLDILSSICSFFIEYFIKFCNFLINNWFILVLVGFSLFVSVIWFAFDIMDLSFFGLFSAKKSIDDYLDKKSDEELKIRESAVRELINRQNRNQVFDPDTNSIVDIPDSSEINNLRFRNFKYYSYGKLNKAILSRSNTPDLPIWFGKEIEKQPISSEEEKELKQLLLNLSDFVEEDLENDNEDKK